MFYEPSKADHGLPHDPFKALVAPRPIGWISTISRRGEVNLAPYSFFNAISGRPPMVMFSSEGRKDSVAFIEEVPEFVCNIVSFDLRVQMNATSAPLPRGHDEMRHAGLEAAPSRLVRPPRVKAAPAALECKATQVMQLQALSGPIDRWMVIGEVIGIHIDERYIVDGLVDTQAMQIIARAGYADYFKTDSRFSIVRPPGG